MASQVFQSETFNAPPLPDWLKEESQDSSTKKFTSMPSVGVYPETLQKAVERINSYCPQMFEVLSSVLDHPLRIQVQVDLPIVKMDLPILKKIFTKNQFVRASALFKKGITVSGLQPNAKGLFHVDDLSRRGIVVQRDNEFNAHWDFRNCALTLRHSAYYQYRETDQIHSQVASIMFELQNAQFSYEFRKIWDKGAQVSKEAFVRKLEEIEFTTSRLTFFRLDRIAKQEVFEDAFNTCRYMYDSFPLYYLHQQAVNHSYQYAKAHDSQFKTEVTLPYQGTWPVKFPLPSEGGKLSLEQDTIAKILSYHLEALYEPNELFRMRKEREMRLAVDAVKNAADRGFSWGENMRKNLQFFQEEYAKYVSAHSPERVVNLIENPISVVPEATTSAV